EPRKVRCLHNECGIGRGDENLVILQGWSISKHHASIRALDNGLFIEATGGRAPVRINGKTIKDLQGPIGSTDIVEIGDYRLRIFSDSGRGQAVGEVASATPSPARAAQPAPSQSQSQPVP